MPRSTASAWTAPLLRDLLPRTRIRAAFSTSASPRKQ